MRDSQIYFWIVANLNGRLVVIGPKSSEDEANEFGYQKLDVPFDVVPLHTRDRAKATSQVKARRLDATGDLERSIQRARHKI